MEKKVQFMFALWTLVILVSALTAFAAGLVLAAKSEQWGTFGLRMATLWLTYFVIRWVIMNSEKLFVLTKEAWQYRRADINGTKYVSYEFLFMLALVATIIIGGDLYIASYLQFVASTTTLELTAICATSLLVLSIVKTLGYHRTKKDVAQTRLSEREQISLMA